MRSTAVTGVLALVFLGLATTALADLPVVGDSFQATGGGRSPSTPLDGMPTQRGHRTWQASPGAVLEADGLVTSGPSEVAGLRFSFLDHPYAARGVIDTVIDPGDAGWVGIGFADTARTPLPQSGQVWVDLSANGRLTVRAGGSRYLVHLDPSPHPAFVDGPNRLRLEYDRATNAVRLWLNRVEVGLEEPDLDVFGFTPDIRLAGFQGHFRSRTQKAVGAVIQTFSVALGEEDLGDTFTLGDARKLKEDDLLDGVPIETGGVIWSATGSTMLGNNFITNNGNATDPKAGVPFNPTEHPGYRAAAVEAVADVAGAGGWFGLGFTNAPASSLWSSGLVWVLIQSDGRVKVNIEGTAHNLYNALLNPTLPAHVKIEYDRVSNSVRAWVNGQELALTSNLVDHDGYTPAITHASFHRFTATQHFPTSGLFYLDDFAVTMTPIEPLGFAVSPTSATAPEYDSAELTCAASGGFPPYSYHWERNRFGCVVMPQKGVPGWTDVPDGNGISGSQTGTLRFDPVDLDHENCYRCVVTDSNTAPATLTSGSANLNVRETVARDEFDNVGLYRFSGDPLNGTLSTVGDLVWTASGQLVLSDDQLTTATVSGATSLTALVPVAPTWVEGYRTVALEGEIEVPEAANDYVELGFKSDPNLGSFRYAGQLYVRLFGDGTARVVANSTYNLLTRTPVPSFLPAAPNSIKIQYDTESHAVRAWVNHVPLTLTYVHPEDNPNLPGFVPSLAHAGLSVTRPFPAPYLWHAQSLTLSVDTVDPPPAFTVTPALTYSGLGYGVPFTCSAEGGVGLLALQWERWVCNDDAGCDQAWTPLTSGEQNVTIDTVPGQGAASSTLTLADVDKSDEGWVRCVVTDSALEPRAVESASAWLGVDYPDFALKTEGWGSSIEAYRVSDSARVSQMRVGETYRMTAPLDWDPDRVAPSLSVPVRLWGRCHVPEPDASAAVDQWFLLSEIVYPLIHGTPADLQFTVPLDCVDGPDGQRDWSILTLRMDVNIERPSDPPPYPCTWTGALPYPCDAFAAEPVLPEYDFGDDNQFNLYSWIPVGTAPLAEAIGNNRLNLDFASGADAPPVNLYPEEWTAASVSTASSSIFFSLAAGVGDNENVLEIIPDPYLPYLAWPTLPSETSIDGIIVRYRMEGASNGNDPFIIVGTSTSAPKAEQADPQSSAVVFPQGADNRVDVNAGFEQYHTVVWRREGAEVFGEAPLGDWVGLLGDVTNTSGSTGPPHLFLGFAKWCATTWGGGPCRSDGYPYFLVDYIGAWSATDTAPTWDAEPESLLARQAYSTLAPLPLEVGVGTSQQLCVEVEVSGGHPDRHPPSGLTLAITAPGGAVTTPPAVDGPTATSSGHYAYCMLDAEGQPMLWAPAEEGPHRVSVDLVWGSGTPDPFPENDHAGFDVYAIAGEGQGGRLVYLRDGGNPQVMSDWILLGAGIDAANLDTEYTLGALIALPDGVLVPNDSVFVERIDYDPEGVIEQIDPDDGTIQPVELTLGQAISGEYFLSRDPQADDGVYGIYPLDHEAGRSTNLTWSAAGKMGSTYTISIGAVDSRSPGSEVSVDLVNIPAYMQGDADATSSDAIDEVKGYQPTSLPVSDIETIDPAGGNLMLRIPLTSIRTDGGLAYDVALTYNSKIWAEHYIPQCKVLDDLNHNPLLDPLYSLFYTARGVESFGVGWELRPPHVLVDERFQWGFDTSPKVKKLRSFVDSSGAEHNLFAAPLHEADSSSVCSTEGYGGCRCIVSAEYGTRADECYTWDGSNLRATMTYDGSELSSILVEAPDGTEYLLAQKAIPAERGYVASPLGELGDPSGEPFWLGCSASGTNYSVDFREEAAGFYVTEIRRGPWKNGHPQNALLFTYCNEGSPACVDLPNPSDDGIAKSNAWVADQQRWLVQKIEELGGNGIPISSVDRSVTFTYGLRELASAGVDNPRRYTVALEQIEAPVFGGGPRAEWDLEYETLTDTSLTTGAFRRPTPIDGLFGTETESAAFLSGITLPTGERYRFAYGERGLLADLWLPTDPEAYTSETDSESATISYSYAPYPGDRLPCKTPDGEVTGGCGAGLRGQIYGRNACHLVTGAVDEGNLGVTRRLRRSKDASDIQLTTGTTFTQYRACNPEPRYWPYRDGVFEEFANQISLNRGYLWTWIETGDADAGSSSARQAEVQRFALRTRRQFSRDQLSLVPGGTSTPATVPPDTYDDDIYTGHEEVWTHEASIRRLSHQQTWWTRLHTVVPHTVDDVEDYSRYDDSRVRTQGLWPEWETTWTNPVSVSDGSPALGSDDIRTCYATSQCMAVETHTEVNDLLQTTKRTMTVANAPAGAEVVPREWRTEYYNPLFDVPLDGEPWRLGFVVREGVCDGSDCSAAWPTSSNDAWRITSRSWVNTSDLTSGTPHFYLPDLQIAGPDPSTLPEDLNEDDLWFPNDAGTCGDDCIQHAFLYDDDGNLTSDTVSGGYYAGSAPTRGGVSTLKTNYAYSHGRASKKWIGLGEGPDPDPSTNLILWERGIDPTTRFVEWHLDSSGSGSAYSYDASRRVTDILPIEGSPSSHGVPSPSGSSTEFQFMKGLRVNYYAPGASGTPKADRTVHEVLDLACTNTTWSTCSTGTMRSYTAYDELGQMVQQTEHLPAPPGSGLEATRSRFMTRDWATDGRAETTSEWYRGTSFPGVGSLKGTTTVAADGLGRPTSTTAADESLVTTAYAGDSITAVGHSVAGSGGLVTVTDTTVKDAFGRLRSAKEGAAGIGNPGVSSSYDYNVEDRLVEVSVGSSGQQRTFDYSPGGFLVGSVEPERRTSDLIYDALGHPLSETTGDVTTTFTYDGFGRLSGTSASTASTASEDLTLVTFGGPAGVAAELWTSTYGRVLSASQKAGANSGFTITNAWQYSGPGRRVSSRSTSVVSKELGISTGFNLGYGYDAWGNLSDLTSPGGTVTDSYDGSWILSSTSPGAGVVNLAGFSYLPNGRVSGLCLGDPNPDLTPDPDGCTILQVEEADASLMARPGSISAKVDDVVEWTTGNYGYDGSGNVMTIGLRDYEYDALSRLRRFDGPGFGSDSWVETFEYDDFGNITRWNGTTLGVDAGTNRLTAATYDSLGRGNMVAVPAFGSGAAATLTYSLEDRVLSTTSAAGMRTYAYDTGGERVVERDGAGALTLFARDESGRVLSELGSDGLARKALLYAGGRLAAELENGELNYVVTDHLGSTRVLARMDAGEVVLDELEMFPFGAMMPGSATPEVDQLFTGHERDLDSTGLDYMHARYYSSGLGRFLSVDPVPGEIGLSQSWNRYAYVRNNPLVLVDPTGEKVSVASLDAEQRAKLLSGLREFTGNTYDVDDDGNLRLVELAEEERSQTATDFLGDLIDSDDVFDVVSTGGRNQWNEDTKKVEINFHSFDNAEYGRVDSRTYNYGSTLVHELYHGASGWDDLDYSRNPPIFDQFSFDWTGPVVDFVNKIRSERCLPLRASYLGERNGAMRFNHVNPNRPNKIYGVTR